MCAWVIWLLGYIDLGETGLTASARRDVLSISAWLGAFEHPVVDQINQRIEDITGLDVSTAEDLQVTLTWICIYLHTTPIPQHERFSQSFVRWRTMGLEDNMNLIMTLGE